MGSRWNSQPFLHPRCELLSTYFSILKILRQVRMSSYQEAFEKPAMKTGMEVAENPQSYDQAAYAYQHVRAARHILGLVGGNEVSGIQGNRVDLESDLQGITRPTTRGNDREHQPLYLKQTMIERKNAKYTTPLKINVEPVHQPTYQMWAYPATLAPEPFRKEACQNPEKF